jgi:hypothetical protein
VNLSGCQRMSSFLSASLMSVALLAPATHTIGTKHTTQHTSELPVNSSFARQPWQAALLEPARHMYQQQR